MSVLTRHPSPVTLPTVVLTLVDSLRCPADHAESTLVLSAESWMDARVWRGELGCPICHARYPITEGVVDFTRGAGGDSRLPDESLSSDALRLAAQLGLAEPGGLVMLTGRYTTLASPLLELVDVTCLLVDPPPGASGDGVVLRLLERVPLATAALRAAAVDDPRDTPAFLMEVTRALRNRARLVAPSTSALPHGVRELARDEREWVGEVESAGPVTPLRRAAPR